MLMINPHDLAELLDRKGYYVDDDDGEVTASLDPYEDELDDLLILLAAVECLQLKRKPVENQLGFYLPHWRAYEDMEQYCKEFPQDPACLDYDA